MLFKYSVNVIVIFLYPLYFSETMMKWSCGDNLLNTCLIGCNRELKNEYKISPYSTMFLVFFLETHLFHVSDRYCLSVLEMSRRILLTLALFSQIGELQYHPVFWRHCPKFHVCADFFSWPTADPFPQSITLSQMLCFPLAPDSTASQHWALCADSTSSESCWKPDGGRDGTDFHSSPSQTWRAIKATIATTK